MATPRKRWFTVECSLYREPWPREIKLSLVMLGMLMADRWAADKLTPKQATVAHLSLGDMLTVTGCETREESLEILREMSRLVSLKITDLDNGFVRVVWPKLLKTQTWNARIKGTGEPEESPDDAPHKAPPHPHTHKEDKRREDSATRAEDGRAPDKPPWDWLEPMLAAQRAEPPPGEGEVSAWLEAIWPEIDAAAEAEAPAPEKHSACAKRVAHARWRTYLQAGERRYRTAAEDARWRELAKHAETALPEPTEEAKAAGRRTAAAISARATRIS